MLQGDFTGRGELNNLNIFAGYFTPTPVFWPGEFREL